MNLKKVYRLLVSLALVAMLIPSVALADSNPSDNSNTAITDTDTSTDGTTDPEENESNPAGSEDGSESGDEGEVDTVADPSIDQDTTTDPEDKTNEPSADEPSVVLNGQFSGGTGTAADPYQMSTAQDFKDLDADLQNGTTYNGAYFVLTNDISSGWDGFAGVGDPSGGSKRTFTGNFDGGGHTVSNLTLNLGFFAQVGANSASSNTTIKDLNIQATLTPNNNYAGMLTGNVASANSMRVSISNCSVSGTIDAGAMTYVGGLVGNATSAEIANSSSNVTINSTGTYIGGLVGRAVTTNISDCKVAGRVAGSNIVGGVGGDVQSGTVSSCQVSGSVSGSEAVGGVVGRTNTTGMANVRGNYCSATVTGADAVGGIVGAANNVNLASNSFNGSVSGSEYVGGIAGQGNANASMQMNLAQGSVSASGGDTSGGIVGAANGATVQNNFVALESIDGTPTAYRIFGGSASSSSNNYSWTGTKVNGAEITDDDPTDDNGASVSTEQLLNTEEIPEPMNAWGSPWVLTAGFAPVLNGINGQLRDWPSYVPRPVPVVPDPPVDPVTPDDPAQPEQPSTDPEPQDGPRLGFIPNTGDDMGRALSILTCSAVCAIAFIALSRKQELAFESKILNARHAR